MNDTARTTLARLVARYGVSVAHDANRCEGLLRDTCPDCTKEIFILTSAVRQRVPADLLAPRQTLPLPLVQGFMVKRLMDELGLSDDAAHWAVASWSEALGLSDPARTSTPVKNMPPPQQASPASGSTSPALREQWASDLAHAPVAVRLGIIRNLAANPDPGNIRLLVRTLDNESGVVRAAAFDVLADPALGAADALIGALGDQSDGVIWRAALVLADLRERRAVPALVHLLGRQGLVRESTVWALGEIRCSDAVTPLMNLATDPDPGIRSAAEDALKKIGLP
jgi:HEAT repeat protein